MSTIIEELNTGNFAIFNKNVTKTFIFGNKFETGEISNPGAEVTLEVGTVMGRVATTNLLVPMTSGATDGSQFPVGILACKVTLPAASTVHNQPICIAGEVAKDKVILDGSDTLTTVVALKTIGDRIGSDTVGIKLVVSTELTGTDNA